MTDSRLTALGWTHIYSGKVRDLYTSEAVPAGSWSSPPTG